MEPALRESEGGSKFDSSGSSIEELGTVHMNGEVNGLEEDPLEISSPDSRLKFSDPLGCKNIQTIEDVSISDDESISSKENGSVKVPNNELAKSGGTKVPASVVDLSEMDVDDDDDDGGDSDGSVAHIDIRDPLDSSDEHNSDEKHLAGELNNKLEPNGNDHSNSITNSVNHKVKDNGDAAPRENGGSHSRSSDVDEASNDSVHSARDIEILDKTFESESDATKDDVLPDAATKSGETTPAKVKKPRKSLPPANITPRRSSRNLSRVQKSYSEPKDDADLVDREEGSDVEEIALVDPLADSKPIIVKDTRKLVEIAAGARSMKGGSGKKEPTLVIIDTNSILAGRGPIPVSHTPHRPSPLPSTSRPNPGYTILPVGLPAQGMIYPKARITPFPPQAHQRSHAIPITIPIPIPKPQPPPPPPPPPPPILPTLTDDMYVVEAPSFIVPYVYEKPPLKPLKDYIKKLSIEIERLTKLEEEEDEEERRKEEDKKKESEEDPKAADVENRKEEAELDEKQKNKKTLEDECDETKQKEKEENDEQDKETVSSDKLDNEKGEKATKATSEETSVKSVEKGKDEDVEDESSDDDDEIKGKKKSSDSEKIPDASKPLDDSGVKNDTADGEEGKVDSKDSIKDGKSEKPLDKLSTTIDEVATDEGASKLKEKKSPTYFDNPLGKFFMQIGTNLVTEFVQTDLLRHQRRKRDREGKISASAQYAVNALMSNLELSKENNKPFHLPIKKCEHCNFKTESALVMSHHLETPHTRNYIYRCSFCPVEVRNPHDILFHMEAEHNVRGRMDRAPAFHQCPNCTFEDNQKGKLTRHLLSCAKKYVPEKNLEPPSDWEPPAKIPRVSRNRPQSMGLGTAAYQAMIAKQGTQHMLPKIIPAQANSLGAARQRGRPTLSGGRYQTEMKIITQGRTLPQATQIRPGMLYRPSGSGAQPQVLLPTTYQITGNQLYQVVGSQGHMMPVGSSSRLTMLPQGTSGGPSPVAFVPNIASGGNTIRIQSTNNKQTTSKMPSISITPLPRQPATSGTMHGRSPQASAATPGKTYVICEICDGYIKDLEQLRNHMLWIHKVKIHPKMIHNRPPLNCQKCQCRFFTDQGLERHLLGTHGLVTSSMQEAANKGKDAGRCPACGRVYQWKLLNHVARDHGMVLKPAHLSYKCTVCTATFGMYKQFENHVYSAHSTQAKRVMDKKPGAPSSSTAQVYRSSPNESKSLLKPLKMNDEITIIPQPSPTQYRLGPASKTGKPSILSQSKAIVHECQLCDETFDGPSGFAMYLAHIQQSHLQSLILKTCKIDECKSCIEKHITQDILNFLEEKSNDVDVIELSDDECVIAGQGRNEITITKLASPPGPRRFKQRMLQKNNVQVIDLAESPVKTKENGEDSLTAVKERLRRRKSLEISQVDSEPEPGPSKKRRRHND